MAEYRLQKRYINHFGLDLKSSDLARPDVFSTGMMNAQYRKSGSIEKRKGYQAHAESQGGYGLFNYNRVNPTTNIEEPEVISISSSAHKLQFSTLDVSYAGAEAVCILSIFFDPDADEYKCQILEGTTIVLDEGLGKGFDEASPKTIDSLRADIDALSGFSASVTGATTTPAAFIRIVRDFDLVSADYEGVAAYWTELNKTLASPFGGSETNKNAANFENVSGVQLQNVFYFANGYDEVMKYDGQTLYRAGVPDPASLTSAVNGAGSVTGTDYFHAIQYIQKDAVGNFIEGNNLRTTTGISPSAQSMDVTIANIQAGSGFNTNCAIVDGAQVSVTTITVDDGGGGSHTLQVGDTAYFFDSVSGDYVEREVTAITGTSITISGAAVTVADNDVISNNLRIALYRTKTGGSSIAALFLVAEIPNNSFSATQVYNDDLTDVQLGALFTEPLTDRSPPPKGRYISSFRNQIVICGKFDDPQTVFYSDVDGPEYFPNVTNSFIVDSGRGDIITGCGPNNEVFCVFLEKSIFIVSGNIADGTIRVDQLQGDIGCSAHATIQDVKGSLFFLSDRGPFQMIGGQIPIPLGEGRIEPVFDGSALTPELRQLLFGVQSRGSDKVFNLKRSVGFNDRRGQKYWLLLPTETTTGGDVHLNSNAKVFVYDYGETLVEGQLRPRDAWLMWDNINMLGGIVFSEDELYWVERRYSDFNTSVDHILYRQHNTEDAWDYEDNDAPITWSYDGNWEALGEPSLLKRFLRLRLFDIEETINNDVVLTVRLETNYKPDVLIGEFTLDFAGGGYGVSEYSTAPWGNPSEPTRKNKLNPGRVRSMRIRYINENDQENVVITGWELEIATPFRFGFKS